MFYKFNFACVEVSKNLIPRPHGRGLGMRLGTCVLSSLVCTREYVREKMVQTVGLKRTGNQCSGGGSRGRCR